MTTTTEKNNPMIDQMFKVGAHYGFSKSKRHPSAKPFIFGLKNRIEIIDLEKSAEQLERTKEFVRGLAAHGKQLLLVSSKHEARLAIENGGEAINQPYVAGRWIGGTLTNFPTIRKRIARLEDLKSKKDKGELAKYTKKEQLLLDRETKTLEEKFGGIAVLTEMPGALFVVDLKKEAIAVAEAKKRNIPVISLSSTDCDMTEADYSILANDNSKDSIQYFVSELVNAFREGKK